MEQAAAHESPRERLQPGDLFLKHRRGYQAVRRLVLAFSVLWTLALPLWWLSVTEAQGAGVGGELRWAGVGRWLELSADSPFVGAPWTVRLWRLELLDPLAAAGLIAAGQASVEVLLGLLVSLLLVLVFGRFFCGWLCPYLPILAVSNATRWLLKQIGFSPLDLQVPRWVATAVLAAVLSAAVAGGVQLAPLIYPPSVIGREAFRAVFQGALGGGALFIFGVFLFDTFISRAGFCRSLCPGGAMFRLLSPVSPVKVVRNPPACTDCTACDVVCNLGQLPMTDKLDTGCERCGKCIAVCPTDALRFEARLPGRKE